MFVCWLSAKEMSQRRLHIWQNLFLQDPTWISAVCVSVWLHTDRIKLPCICQVPGLGISWGQEDQEKPSQITTARTSWASQGDPATDESFKENCQLEYQWIFRRQWCSEMETFAQLNCSHCRPELASDISPRLPWASASSGYNGDLKPSLPSIWPWYNEPLMTVSELSFQD